MSTPAPPIAQADAQIRAIAEVLRADGRVDGANALITQLEAPPKAKPALFVAGEDKRGKSCLVNALLGRPDLSPVGVEIVTAAPITFFQDPGGSAQVYRYGVPEPVSTPFEEARALATVEGNPRNQENIRAVALGVDSPLLAGFNLIDTPGVGGLDSGHATLTLQSIQTADALMFVSEAGAPFRAEELAFLRRASARVETVILVLTKIDLHRGWRTILADDIAILKEQAPRFATCPIVPVSSVLALRALAQEDPQDARLMREESGIAQLEAVIAAQVVARGSTLQTANVLRTGLGALASVEVGLRETLGAAGGDEAPRKALEAERARLQQLQKDRSLGPQMLDVEIRKLTLERSEAAARATVEIRRRYDGRLRDVKKKEFDELPGELVADLTALAGRLNEDAATRLNELVGKLMHDIDDTAPLAESIRAVTNQALKEELEATSIGDYGMSTNDKFSVLTSFSSGRSLESIGALVAGALIAPPVGIVLGLGLGGLFAFQAFISRDQHAFVAAFNSWMAAQISQAQLTMNNTFQRQMIDLQLQIRDTVQAALVEREQEITTALHNAEALVQTEATRRAQATGELKQHLEAIVALRSATFATLAALAQSGTATPTAAAAAAGAAPAAPPAPAMAPDAAQLAPTALAQTALAPAPGGPPAATGLLTALLLTAHPARQPTPPAPPVSGVSAPPSGLLAALLQTAHPTSEQPAPPGGPAAAPPAAGAT